LFIVFGIVINNYAQSSINVINGVYIERIINDTLIKPYSVTEEPINNNDIVAFEMEGFSDYAKENKIILSQIVLLIDDIKLIEFPAYIENTESDIVRFRFLNKKLNFENRKQLYKLTGSSMKEALIGIKIDESNILYFNQPVKLNFKEIKRWVNFGGLLIGVFTLLFMLLIFKYDSVLKSNISAGVNTEDSNPDIINVPDQIEVQPNINATNIVGFSYSKSQFAFWTFVIVTSFIYIWAFTGDIDSLNNTALILLGITSATIVTSNLINKSEEKNLKSQSRKQKIIQKSNFWVDILSDADGISMHRLQAVIFNLVFGIAFFKSVIFDYTMPEFSETQLILLGLSNGTYAFLKKAENR
jgi:hypothetical protein